MSVAQPTPPGATKDEIRQRALDALVGEGLPFLVGGGYAFANYTPILRVPKDLDLFVVKSDLHRVLDALARAGFRTEVTFSHWLGKAYAGEEYIDVIYSSGNGIVRVDESWFRHAPRGHVLGHEVQLIPPEEMIWSKAFVAERERYDGADVNHIVFVRGDQMDWEHLLWRFDEHWAVLFSHLVLFRFSYPGHRHLVPRWVWDELLRRASEEESEPDKRKLCRGTLLSKAQYRIDLDHWGFEDARVVEVENFRDHYRQGPDRGGG